MDFTPCLSRTVHVSPHSIPSVHSARAASEASAASVTISTARSRIASLGSKQRSRIFSRKDSPGIGAVGRLGEFSAAIGGVDLVLPNLNPKIYGKY